MGHPCPSHALLEGFLWGRTRVMVPFLTLSLDVPGHSMKSPFRGADVNCQFTTDPPKPPKPSPDPVEGLPLESGEAQIPFTLSKQRAILPA